MAAFKYGQEALDYLKKKDKKLGLVIDRIGFIERGVEKDLFAALAESIVSQQLSAKAADAIWNRLTNRLGAVEPEAVAAASREELAGLGLSGRKAEYLKGIAETVLSGGLDLDALQSMPDAEVIERLSALKGIGVWTAEMLLIFSLERQDILSWGDLAIRRGITRLYGLKELTREKFEVYRKRYSPYGSVASLYIWAVSHEKSVH